VCVCVCVRAYVRANEYGRLCIWVLVLGASLHAFVSVCICVPFDGNLTQPSSETIALLQLRASTLVAMVASVAMSSSAPTATARPATPETHALVRTLCSISLQTVEFKLIITILNYECCGRRIFESACPTR